VYPIAAAIIGAQKFWVLAAAKALGEDCPVEARCVAGALNPETGAAKFTSPEIVITDLAVAQLFRQKYGIPCGTGVGLIDALFPELCQYLNEHSSCLHPHFQANHHFRWE